MGEIASLQSQINLQQTTIGTLKDELSKTNRHVDSLMQQGSSTPAPLCTHRQIYIKYVNYIVL